MTKFNIKFATKEDIHIILKFIQDLAIYERLEGQVVATPELLEEWIFEKEKAKVILAYEDEKPIGFALYCYNFSTFLGKPGIWLEDLYIINEHRGKGYGKKLLKFIVNLAIENDYGRVEWACLDWNQPSIDFYLSLDARAMDEWTTYRLEGDNLKHFCENH
ncbi:acetyltransferase (GNAT family) [Campylobacter blaseri]|uniref:GNAT family N-acetyltransferase n=1 Tax=Campylobacter blaseri TaxID=2042961 RepID=A0A2P8R244_9BACT|nr:GNAT family N-acetyltransferase [Campylobacter blaseri]PSM52570.1 GNAT family N-acetyltransferase [Campylobacter blaseri]PSM54218.1 GNAT family N-acetyltransferase [Campylobacter blaseri]QKF85869.1 acetyltransferase (GNAT family) [Campylobacter blaseri]